MKTFSISAIVLAIFGFSACSNNSQNSTVEEAGSSHGQHVETIAKNDSNLEAISPTFTNVSREVSSSIKLIVEHYLHIKTALTNEDDKEAAAGAKLLSDIIASMDKSILNEEQKVLFDENEADLKEHADHIGENSGNIKHQREHFVMLSEDVYALVKGFGGERKLYKAHCPMADNNAGATWLTETNEVKNPYYGASMLTCGSIDEVIN